MEKIDLLRHVLIAYKSTVIDFPTATADIMNIFEEICDHPYAYVISDGANDKCLKCNKTLN